MSTTGGGTNTQKPSSSKAGVATIPLQHKTDGSKYSLEECYGKVVEIVNKAAGNVGIKGKPVKYDKNFQVYGIPYLVPKCIKVEIEYDLAVLIVQALSNYFGYLVSKGSNINEDDKYKDVLTSLSNLIEEYACKQTVQKPVHANAAHVPQVHNVASMNQYEHLKNVPPGMANESATHQAAQNLNVEQDAARQDALNKQNRLVEQILKRNADKKRAQDCHDWKHPFDLTFLNKLLNIKVNADNSTSNSTSNCIDGISIAYIVYELLLQKSNTLTTLLSADSDCGPNVINSFKTIFDILFIKSPTSNIDLFANIRKFTIDGDEYILVYDFLRQLFTQKRCKDNNCDVWNLKLEFEKHFKYNANHLNMIHNMYQNTYNATINACLSELTDKNCYEGTSNNIITYIRFRGTTKESENENVFSSLITQDKKCYIKAELKDYKEKNYISGPYTKIFYHDQTNQKVVNGCEHLTNALNDKKSIFVVGYGASGAGKTSTLINYRDEIESKNEEGILIKLIDKLNYKPDKIILNIHEYYKPDKYKTDNIHSLDKVIEFIKNNENGKYILNEEDIQNPKSKKYNNVPVILPKGIELHTCIVKLMDEPEMRRIAATTNNPQSSRSHVLISLKLGDTDDSPYMFIADFAGVENKFQCDSLQELIRFANIKNNRTGDLFYNVDSIKNDKDLCNINQEYDGKYDIPVYLPSDVVNVTQQLNMVDSSQVLREELIKINTIYTNTNNTIDTMYGHIENYYEQANKDFDDQFNIAKKDENKTNLISIIKGKIRDMDGNLLTGLNFSQTNVNSSTYDGEFIHIGRANFNIEKINNFNEQIILRLKIPNISDSNNVYSHTISGGLLKGENIILPHYEIVNGQITTTMNTTELTCKKLLTGTIDGIKITLSNPTIVSTINEIKYIDKNVRLTDNLLLTQPNTGNKFKFINETDKNMIFIVYQTIRINDTDVVSVQEDNMYEQRKEVAEKIYEYYTNCIKRLKIIKEICKCRSTEGEYINLEIEAMRTTIFDLISKKKNAIKYIPPVLPKCEDQLFPLIQMDPTVNTKKPSTLLSTHMIDVLGEEKIKDLVICVFNVFNNTAKQEDKTLYVDISGLKDIYQRWYLCLNYFNTKYFTLDETNPLYSKIKKYTNIDDIFEEWNNYYTKLLKTLNDHTKSANTYHQTLAKEILEMKFVGNEVQLNSGQFITYKDEDGLQNLKVLIDNIQIRNNTSPLGTLEFMDHISRMDIDDSIVPVCTNPASSKNVTETVLKLQIAPVTAKPPQKTPR